MRDLITSLAEADEALRKLPRIRPPTRDAAGSEQLPIAAATPPPLPLSDTVVRRLLGERGVAIQRHLDINTSAGSYGSIFSESLKSIRLRGRQLWSHGDQARMSACQDLYCFVIPKGTAGFNGRKKHCKLSAMWSCCQMTHGNIAYLEATRGTKISDCLELISLSLPHQERKENKL